MFIVQIIMYIATSAYKTLYKVVIIKLHLPMYIKKSKTSEIFILGRK